MCMEDSGCRPELARNLTGRSSGCVDGTTAVGGFDTALYLTQALKRQQEAPFNPLGPPRLPAETISDALKFQRSRRVSLYVCPQMISVGGGHNT